MNNKLPPTEQALENQLPIDELDFQTAINLLIQDQLGPGNAVIKVSNIIGDTILSIYNKIKSDTKSRIIYVGAGTSGRIAVQDGVELYPTFGWPKTRLDFIIAGGLNALTQAIEGAEDDVEYSKEVFKEKKINKKDIIIGLAASGNTPFTCSIMKQANMMGSLTVGISNNKNGDIFKYAKHKIFLDTGPEIIVGSTRLKAGTAQKVCLNAISSMIMVKLGKVKKGQMVNLVATNKKLIDRKNRIFNDLQSQEKLS